MKEESTLFIKNMVCPRCIETVKGVFHELNIQTATVQLGEVTTQEKINPGQRTKLESGLLAKGFELLQDQKSKLIAQVKAIIIGQIHYSKEVIHVNFSTLLTEKINHEYASLSRLFSSVEGITIERFILKQKTERVKELIFYNEQTLSEISFQMGYSSVAHLSAQFKKETGMTPSEFKKLKKPAHSSLDRL